MIRWFTLHPVAANIFMVMILVVGLFSLSNVKTEVIPGVEIDWVDVSIPFPGMSSQGIEQQGIENLEQRINALPGVDEIHTNLRQGMANIQVMLRPGSSDEHLAIKSDIRAYIETVKQPAGAPAPTVFQMKIQPAVAALAVTGPHAYQDLEVLALQLKRQLEALPEVGEVSLYLPGDRETAVILHPQALATAGLTAAQVAHLLRTSRHVVDLGQIRQQGVPYQLVADNQQASQRMSDIGNPVLRELPDGSAVYLEDVAHVVSPSFAHGHRLNGERAVLLTVKSAQGSGLVSVSDRLQEFISDSRRSLPKGIELELWQDTSKYFKARIQVLIENGVVGFTLLFLILAVFLHWRLSFWVSLGLPVAFFGGFTALWLSGYSLNMVSLFAFILVLGILVDDAIIVGESVHSTQQRWRLSHQAQQASLSEYAESRAARSLDQLVVRSVMRVSKPVCTAALTTMLMFVPLLFLPGDEGRMLRAIPIVVIATLAFSLVESLLVLPAHLRRTPRQITTSKPWRISIFTPIADGFQNLLRRNIDNPWISQAFFLGGVLILLAVLFSGRIDYSFFANIEGDLAVAGVTMEEGASQQQLESMLDQLESSALAIQQRHEADDSLPDIKNVLRKHMDANGSRQLQGQVALEMSTEDAREIAAQDVADQWRRQVDKGDGVESIQIQTSLNASRHTKTFYLQAQQRSSLEDAAFAIGKWLQDQPGVDSVELKGASLEPQVLFELNAQGKSLGLTQDDIAQQTRVILAEEILFNLAQTSGDSPVRLRMSSKKGVTSLSELAQLPIVTGQGQVIRLGDVAELRETQQTIELSRHHGLPSVEVIISPSAEANTKGHWLQGPWQNTIKTILDDYYSDVEFVSGMYQQEQVDIEQYLVFSFILALFCMYGLMAVLLRSYWMPIAILYAVPFGLMGAVLGHWLLSLPFTLYSLIGAFAVSGIVVNDNLVLMDQVQFEFATQHNRVKAIAQAVCTRARAVMLTTLTTVLGMVPLIVESSIQSQFLKPMAVSLAFGVATATCITLFLMPATLAIFMGKRKEPMPVTA